MVSAPLSQYVDRPQSPLVPKIELQSKLVHYPGVNNELRTTLEAFQERLKPGGADSSGI
jgi:hypothetical protein